MASKAGKGRLRTSTRRTSEFSRCAARARGAPCGFALAARRSSPAGRACGERGAAGGTPRPRRDTRISEQPAGRDGFTLLEALVALAISGLVLVALYGAVVRAVGVRERVARSAERVTKARTVLLLMAREVEGALVPGAPGTPERFI